MFDKILIANRGAIAVRIARTCERMGVATVAVHSDIEAEALHTTTCDEAVCIGGARAQDSYLRADAIIEAAKQTGAQAIHPGYGLLSESADFARAVTEAGLTFVGPSADAVALFGDKVKARNLAAHAGVRIVPGSDATVEDLASARTIADQLGYPVMIKAAGGGGGIGMQRIEDEDALERALETCRSRAQAAFGDDRVFIEKALERPRHLEVQVIADRHDHCVALGERECSIQRRHQKLLEETPSPALSAPGQGDLKRDILCDAAVRIAREAGYEGAGTAEFLLDADDRIFFVEFNPRLQVEHGLTEMCTNLDIVELQLLVAAGEPLPQEALHAEPSGHAMEARIYAEDATKDFVPRPGLVENLRWPIVAPGSMRVETGVTPGTEMTHHYDPLVAKLIAFGPTRHQALLTLDRVLAETVIGPLTTNINYLRAVLAHESFRAGQYDTQTAIEIEVAPPESREAKVTQPPKAKVTQPPKANAEPRAREGGPRRRRR